MMMPANFTAVNSEVVYGGADLFSILADTTAPVWNAANVKQFNTNVITLVSNSFFQKAVNSTLGVMFSGNWGGDNGQKIFGDDGSLKTNFYGATANGDDMTSATRSCVLWVWLLSSTPWAPLLPRSASTTMLWALLLRVLTASGTSVSNQ